MITYNPPCFPAPHSIWASRVRLHSNGLGGHVKVYGMKNDFQIVSSLVDGSHRLLINWGKNLESYPMERRDK